MSTKPLVACLVFVLVVMGCRSAGAVDSPGMTTITIGTSYPGVDELPIYIGEKLGYFVQEKISPQLVSLSTGDKIVYALLGGSIDIARYTPDWIIRAANRGSKLKIVLGSSNNLVFSLVAQSDVRTYADLKGKRIGVSTLSAADATVVRKMAAANGLGANDYILIPAGASPQRSAALRSGSLSATVLSAPSDQMALDNGGLHRIDLSTNVVKHYAWGGQAVRQDWAEANRPALVSYMRAWIKGDRWLRDDKNKDAVVSLLAEKGNMERKYAQAEYELYFGRDALAVPADGQMNPVDYQALIDDMAAAGQFPGARPSAAEFLDPSYQADAIRSLK